MVTEQTRQEAKGSLLPDAYLQLAPGVESLHLFDRLVQVHLRRAAAVLRQVDTSRHTQQYST